MPSAKKIWMAIAMLIIGTACMNMPTPPAQITGSYASDLKYENLDCLRLDAELNSLARRENELTIAQEERIKTSEMQAFWWGFGQGDGIEAAELANVKGEKEAVRKAMEARGCTIVMPIFEKPVKKPIPKSNSHGGTVN